MKKTLISAISVFVFLPAMFLLLAASTNDDPVKRIADEHIELREQIEGGTTMTDGAQNIKIALGYAELFEKIADGTADRENEYAQLLREITQYTIEFDDNEVFAIADDLARDYSYMAEGNEDFGVQEIKVSEDNSKGVSLIIDYIGLRGYSVRMMDDDEMEYSGENLVEYDGSLGKNRIEITFYDASVSARFAEQYPIWDDHELKGVSADLGIKLNIKGVYTSDHAVVIYIGSDNPLSISEQEFTGLNRPTGSIEVVIN